MLLPSILNPSPPIPLNFIIFKAQIIIENLHRSLGRTGSSLTFCLSSTDRVTILLKLQGHKSGKEDVAGATKTNRFPPSFAGYQATLKIDP